MPADLATRRALLLTLAAVAVLAPLGALSVAPAQAVTDSAKTVAASDYDPDAANAPFPDLRVTVSQTEDLIQQGVTVSWTGGRKSSAPSQQTGGRNYLQIAQCWGDEPGSNGTRPDRTTCQYGGLNVAGDSRYAFRTDADEAASEDAPYTAIGADFFHPTMTAIPFHSATGDSVESVVDGKEVPGAPDLNNNQFFNKLTTNEVSWAGMAGDGSGSVSFELQTVQQSPGLGCGTPRTAGGVVSGTSCWLVVIPRGTTDATGGDITQSGLFWETWKHHIAVRMNFKPSGVHCAIGAAERQLSGSELLGGAVGQWQPKLCNMTNGAVYSLLTGPETDAAVAANGTTAAPMALTSRALSRNLTDNLAYAPVGLTGVSVAFAIDYQAKASSDVPDSVLAKERQAVGTLKLTPRLLAKLLTASYTDALPQASDKSHLTGARNLTKDPDFLAINDDVWKYMAIASVGVSDVLMPLGRSDAAYAVWTYIMADADARAFMAGKADPWGMKVNPYFSTSKRVNPAGVGMSYPIQEFPKADPTEFTGLEKNGYADVVNLVTWRPYTASLDIGGYDVLRGDALKLGAWDSISQPPKFGKGDRDLVGLQAVMGLTDAPAAAKYQVVQASLRNPAGIFVTPTNAALTAAAAVMTRDADQSQVEAFDPTSSAARNAKDAYPLAMPVYAAVNPKMEGADLRADYAAFITYAVGDGQTVGTDDGELPAGYAPLPAAWKAQAIAAAAAIKSGTSPTPSHSPTVNSSSSSGSTSSGVSTTTPGPTAGPTASGDPSGALTGDGTPDDPPVGVLASVVPAGAALGLAAALGVPVMSRFRRRQL